MCESSLWPMRMFILVECLSLEIVCRRCLCKCSGSSNMLLVRTCPRRLQAILFPVVGRLISGLDRTMCGRFNSPTIITVCQLIMFRESTPRRLMLCWHWVLKSDSSVRASADTPCLHTDMSRWIGFDDADAVTFMICRQRTWDLGTARGKCEKFVDPMRNVGSDTRRRITLAWWKCGRVCRVLKNDCSAEDTHHRLMSTGSGRARFSSMLPDAFVIGAESCWLWESLNMTSSSKVTAEMKERTLVRLRVTSCEWFTSHSRSEKKKRTEFCARFMY